MLPVSFSKFNKISENIVAPFLVSMLLASQPLSVPFVLFVVSLWELFRQMDTQDLINAFDSRGEEAESTPAIAEREVDFIMQNIQLAQGANVLDVPCGEGHHSNVLAKKYGLNVTGIDGGHNLIERASNRYKGPNFIEATFDALAEKDLILDESQDAVLCINRSFGYLPTVAENEAFLINMYKKLKVGGALVIHCYPSSEKKVESHVDDGPSVEFRLPIEYILPDESFRTLHVTNRTEPSGFRVKYADYNAMSYEGETPIDMPIVRALAMHAGIDDSQISFRFEAPDNCAITIMKPPANLQELELTQGQVGRQAEDALKNSPAV